jgi:hypothetical protein
VGERIYQPTDSGFEAELASRLDTLQRQRKPR